MKVNLVIIMNSCFDLYELHSIYRATKSLAIKSLAINFKCKKTDIIF